MFRVSSNFLARSFGATRRFGFNRLALAAASPAAAGAMAASSSSATTASSAATIAASLRFRAQNAVPDQEAHQAASAAAAADNAAEAQEKERTLKQPDAPANMRHADYENYSVLAEFESEVRIKMQQKMGEGTYDLYRALYKDLCDEMRREEIARGPPPVAGWVAEHEPGTRFVKFTRTKRAEEDFEVTVESEVAIVDPRTINEVMQFLNWYPFEIFIRREGYVCHISACYVEAQPQVRGVRIYYDDRADPNARGLDMAASESDVPSAYERRNLRYDGPFHGHLELDQITELFDLMLDVGCDCYFMRMASDWIAYFEHVEHTRWMLNSLDAVAPQVRHPITAAEAAPGQEPEYEFVEEDFIAREERIQLDQTAEEWMPARTM